MAVRRRFGDLVVVCRRQGVALYDGAALRDLHDKLGDGATITAMALAWAEAIRTHAGERPAGVSARGALQRACLLGGWLRGPLKVAGVAGLDEPTDRYDAPGASPEDTDAPGASPEDTDAPSASPEDTDAPGASPEDTDAPGASPEDTDPLSASPGDVDEVISALTRLSEGETLGSASLFEVVAALRQGVFEGADSCDVGR